MRLILLYFTIPLIMYVVALLKNHGGRIDKQTIKAFLIWPIIVIMLVYDEL